MHLIFIYQAIWNWSIALVKISIALLLFRIKQTRAWRIFLTSTIALLVLAATTSTFFQFLQCRPFSIYWDPSVLSKGSVKCISHEAMIGGIIATSAIHITTNLLFSFIPITLIGETHKLRSKKIFLAIMMGLGLFAASFAILRTATATLIYASPDVFRATVMPTLWSMLELEIGLIAATIPKLKGFVQQSLVQLGQCFYEEQTEEQMRNRLVQLGYLRPDVNESSDSFAKPPKLDIDVERVRYGPPPGRARKEQDGHVTTVKQPDAAARGAKATKKVQDFDLIRC
ncbi:integral membrane [Pyrenophora seminiperda CCB06]|uniref:Integral membrane n=1 Tax=Pyrenophora seminiperda CCB06 TaxID=1302712 RepID=A0A3M7M120_9PLEO|nr:integral membrane [Pyrenophora seminiperda CCB06]